MKLIEEEYRVTFKENLELKGISVSKKVQHLKEAAETNLST